MTKVKVNETNTIVRTTTERNVVKVVDQTNTFIVRPVGVISGIGAVGLQGPQGATGMTGATGEQVTAKTYDVTVSNPGSGNKYFIDTVQQDTIYLLRGQKYVFSLAGSVSGHPFHLQTTDNGGAYDSGNLYTTGVVNAGADSGDITFTVPYNAPDTLYYRWNKSLYIFIKCFLCELKCLLIYI